MTKLDHRLPPMNTLVSFEAAYRHRNFTRAAEELALSQASISRQIRQLEASLNVRLFERGRRDAVPTPEADHLADTVRRALGDLALIAEQLRSTSSDEKTITIFTELTLASLLLAPCVSAFHKDYPDLSLRIYTTQEPVEAFDDQFDVGLRNGWWGEHSYDIEPVADEAIFPVLSPKLFEQLGPHITWDVIEKAPLLHLSQAGGPWPDWPAMMQEFGRSPPAQLKGQVLNSYEVLLNFAEAGEGIGLGWARSVEGRLESGRLIALKDMTMPMPNHIAAHYSKRKKPSEAAKALMALVRKRFSSLTVRA